MTDGHRATYPLAKSGAVHHWLACGPELTPLHNLDQTIRPGGSPFEKDGRWVLNYWAWDDRSKAMKLRLYRDLPPFTWHPDIQPALHTPGIGKRHWEYAVAEEDQVIDFSHFNFSPTLMRGWLFALLEVKKTMQVRVELMTIGPARIFLNGKLHTHYADEFSYVAIQRIPVELQLKEGLNEVYLYGEMLGWREARLALGLRFLDMYPITINLPLGDIPADKWQRAEDGLSHLQIRQFAFPSLPGYIWLDEAAQHPFGFEAEVTLPLPESIFKQQPDLKLPQGMIHLHLKPGESGELPIVTEVTTAMSSMPGENSLNLKMRPADGTPLEIQRDIWAGRNSFSHEPYSDYDSRRQEAIAHLAQMPYDVPAALAAIALGRVEQVSSQAIALACDFLQNRYDCADFYAIGLLALLYRHGNHPALRLSDQKRIEDTLHGFKFWLDEPGLDAMCYFTENHQILFHVAAYLSGQLWPDSTFKNSGWTGRQQMKRSYPRIKDWILRRLQGNFSEWDSNAYMTLDAFAMLALVEFADSPRLREVATTLLHKIFFLLACQSFRGVHGSTHGRCYVSGLKSARVENTSSLQRIGWGMGILNGETRATAILALAQQYRVPPIIQRIGADVNNTVVTRARSKAQFRSQFDMRGDGWDVRTLTYRSPDVMLSAALDYCPGEFGIQEHLWQATLGPEAVVFTTYPGNSQEHGNARPNFWAGSARLPRVGMAEKTIICLYRLETGVGLGLSHAYFPTKMFDEYILDGQWAFARSGNGYIALWGDGELILMESGRHAGQELRSRGTGEAWLCHVGRAGEDGDFAAFRASVTQHRPNKVDLHVQWTKPDGKTLDFAWDGAFLIDGMPENWDDFPHYDNLYTHTPMNAQAMTIALGEDILTLDMKQGRNTTS